MLVLSTAGELAMARTLAALPEGSRITDYVSLGVITKTFPLKRVRAVLAATGKASQRERDLPAHVVVYYAIALALYMQSSYREVLRCLLEGVQWLLDPAVTLKVAGNSGISQARTRLGWEPLRQLHDEVVKPIAVAATKGAWYRGLRLVSVDGSTLEVADEAANDEAFGRPGASRGTSAFPQLRFVALVENGTHVLFGTQMGSLCHRRDHLGQGRAQARCARACCVWPIGISLASRCGYRPAAAVPICCGGSRSTPACRANNRWSTARI